MRRREKGERDKIDDGNRNVVLTCVYVCFYSPWRSSFPSLASLFYAHLRGSVARMRIYRCCHVNSPLPSHSLPSLSPHPLHITHI